MGNAESKKARIKAENKIVPRFLITGMLPHCAAKKGSIIPQSNVALGGLDRMVRRWMSVLGRSSKEKSP